MSKLETNTIDTISGSTNLTLGGTNATDITIPSGVTITNNGTQSGFGGVNTPLFHVFNSSAQGALNVSTWSTVTLPSEKYDPQSTFASNQFSPSSTGYYYLEGSATCNDLSGNADKFALRIYNATQSSVLQASVSGGSTGGNLVRVAVSAIVNVTDVDDNYELQYWQNAGGSRYLQGDDNSSTYFLGYKLIT